MNILAQPFEYETWAARLQGKKPWFAVEVLILRGLK
jgi:hypothetical protein